MASHPAHWAIVPGRSSAALSARLAAFFGATRCTALHGPCGSPLHLESPRGQQLPELNRKSRVRLSSRETRRGMESTPRCVQEFYRELRSDAPAGAADRNSLIGDRDTSHQACLPVLQATRSTGPAHRHGRAPALRPAGVLVLGAWHKSPMPHGSDDDLRPGWSSTAPRRRRRSTRLRDQRRSRSQPGRAAT